MDNWEQRIDNVDLNSNWETTTDWSQARERATDFLSITQDKLNNSEISQEQFDATVEAVIAIMTHQEAQLSDLDQEFIRAKEYIISHTRECISQEKIEYLKSTFPAFTDLIEDNPDRIEEWKQRMTL